MSNRNNKPLMNSTLSGIELEPRLCFSEGQRGLTSVGSFENSNILNTEYTGTIELMNVSQSTSSKYKEKQTKIQENTGQSDLTANALYQLTESILALTRRVDFIESKIFKVVQKKVPEPVPKPQKNTNRKPRRKAVQIQKVHGCILCDKAYGSQVSLNLHYRIKHPNLRPSKKSKREQLTDTNPLSEIKSSNHVSNESIQSI